MASEIRANKSTNRAGLGTVTYADTGIIVSGIVTCTELSGLTALNISGVGTANTLDINGDIDVDGHTNLDNVNIVGVTTISNDLHIESALPRIYLTDTNHNSDWYIQNSDGTIIFYDTTLTNTRFEIYPGNSPTTRPFISAPSTTDCRFDGFVRIGAVGTSPNHSLTVGGNSIFSGISTFANDVKLSNTEGKIEATGSTGLTLNASGGSAYARIRTAGSERVRITSSGRVIIGHTAASGDLHGSQGTTNRSPFFQLHGNNNSSAGAALISWHGGGGAYYSPVLYLARSGSATKGTNGIIPSGQTFGSIVFNGDDGTDFVKGAMITAELDGTPGTDDMPGRLEFHTTPDGSQSPVERLRITSDGKFGFNDPSPERTIDVKGSNCMIQLEGTGGNGKQYSLCSSDDTTGVAVDGGPSGTFAIYDDTAGAARLRISSSGTVTSHGILVVAGEPSSGVGKFNVKPSTGDEYFKVRDAGDFSGSLNGVAVDIRNSANDTSKDLLVRSQSLVLWQNAEEKLRIDSNGNVKLSTDQLQTLAVKNYGYSSSYKSIMVGNPNSNSGTVALCVDVSGISGSSFHAQNQVITGYRGFLTPNAAGNNFIGVFARDASANKIYFGPSVSGGITNGPLTATSGNKIGINKTDPSNQLHIAGTTGTSAGGLLRLDATTGDNFIIFGNTHDSTEWVIGNDSAARADFRLYYNNGSGYTTQIVAIEGTHNNGKVTIDGGTNTLVNIRADSGGAAGLRCGGQAGSGTDQCTGYVEVHQDESHGGGMFYNGDGSPSFATGEAADYFSIHRLSSGTRHSVMRWFHSSNDTHVQGNMVVDNGTSTLIRVRGDSTGTAGISCGGGDGQTQCTGYLECTQDEIHGGGIFYNGDGSPAFATDETADRVTFYRMHNGTRYEVFSTPYSDSSIRFRGDLRPAVNNSIDLGSSSLRWRDVYCNQGAFNNSDEVLKQDIESLSEIEMRVARKLSGLFKTYKWKDSVKNKGDKARIHTGMIAQQIVTAIESEGLDYENYGFIGYDEWYQNAKGETITLEDANDNKLDGYEKIGRYSVRYTELLSFIAAYNEQRFTDLESRVAALEG